ncbi:hypothetical protein GE061_007999 [Apolygus lucorum]|uniref:Myb/SANT-like DNA-binding domain-containing protein n=1 Tax=Apolygus lucorum TaxID=248454 RepID=A0A6A4J277_APOLU|nr:hypothetical protein GE061_007999 [Apolygus lucorum]
MEGELSQQDIQLSTVGESSTPPRFVWSPELTSAFIALRSSHDELFTKRRNSASHGYSIILQKLVESQLVDDNLLTPRQLRKKWENLLKRYRKLKHAANAGIAQYASGSELTFENWPFYKDMNQILVKQEPVSHHMLLPESASNNTYDYPEEYAVGSSSAKRFRPNVEDCPAVEVVQSPSPSQQPVQIKTSSSPVHVQTRSDVIHRLLNQHERFIALYERLVVALEKFVE